MYMKLGVGIAAGLVLAGCSGPGESAGRDRERQAAADSSVAAPAAAAHDMHAMQDSVAESSVPAAGATAGMAEMDHGSMGGAEGSSGTPAQGAMQGMDHSQMGHATGSAQGRAAGTMDHSGMSGTQHALPIGQGTDKLLMLVRELVQDSVVQRQIQEDPALREAWADSTVRRVILRPR